MAARANPAAMTNGTATEARATYLSTRLPAADLAWLISPANTGRSCRGLRFPQRPEDESGNGGGCQRRHRLILDRLVEGALEVAGHLLQLLARLSALVG